ncbi:MAG: hypothetical protein H6559_25005 [Lewinellaceae bacterium]|nr:hypothetical protein [Lewinellaceae bacterium]
MGSSVPAFQLVPDVDGPRPDTGDKRQSIFRPAETGAGRSSQSPQN